MKTTQVKKLFLLTIWIFCGLLVLTLGCGGGGSGDSPPPEEFIEPSPPPPPKPKPEPEPQVETTVPAFLPAALKTEVEEKWAAATSVAEKTSVIAAAMETRLNGMSAILLTMAVKPEELSKNTKTLNTLETELRQLCRWSQSYSGSLSQKEQESSRRRAVLKIAGSLSSVETAATWSGAKRLGQEVRSIESRMFQPSDDVMAAVKKLFQVAAPPPRRPPANSDDSDSSDEYSDSGDGSSDSYSDSGVPVKAKSIQEAVNEILPMLLTKTDEAKLIATLQMLTASGKQLLTQRNVVRMAGMAGDPRGGVGSMDNSDSSDYAPSDYNEEYSSDMDGNVSQSPQRERLSLDRDDDATSSAVTVTSNTGAARQGRGGGNSGNTSQRTGREAAPAIAMGLVPPEVQLLMLGQLRQALTLGLKQVTEDKASSEELRIAAMEAYCLLADEDILPTITAYVQKKDTPSAAARTCFSAMMTVPDYRSDPRAIGVVIDFLEKDARVVTAALQMAGPLAATLIAPKITSTDKVVRNGALLVVADASDATSILTLLPILESPDANLRQFVLESLGEKGDSRAAKAIAMRLMNSSDLAAATNALIRIGSPGEPIVIGMFGAKQAPQVQASIDLVCINVLGEMGSVHALHPLGVVLERYGRPPAEADMTGIDKNVMVVSTLTAARKIIARSSAAMRQPVMPGRPSYPQQPMGGGDDGEMDYNSDGTTTSVATTGIRPRSLDTMSPPGDKPIWWLQSLCKVAATRCKEANEILQNVTNTTTPQRAEVAAERMKEFIPQLMALKAAIPEAIRAKEMAVSLMSTEERKACKPLLDDTDTAETSMNLFSAKFQDARQRLSNVQPLGAVLSGQGAGATGGNSMGSSDE